MRWVAPSAFACASFFSLLAVAMIMAAPASFATCTAALPMPEPAAWISTVCPACRPPRLMSTCHAVPKAICAAAASSKRTCEGRALRLAIGTATYSA
jgi:hypothetical protein